MSNAPLKLLSSMATRELLSELLSQYERASGRVVKAEAAGGVDVAKRVQAGEAADVVVLANNAIDKLIADGKVLTGSRVDLVRSGVSIAVKAGAPRPDVSSESAVKDAVEAARTISYSTGPSGVYLEKMFARWGILEALRSRIVVPPPGIPVGSLVAKGEVELGFQQLSELLNLPGIDVIGPLPPAIQTITVFSAGLCAASADVPGARALIEYLAKPEAASVKHKYGMEPA